MKDLRSQLAAQLGREPPPPLPEPPATGDGPLDLLHPDAHLDTPWIAELTKPRRVPGGPEIPPRPSLGAAQMLTDQLAKAMKKSGRGKDGKALKALREKFLTRRDKQAWAQIKLHFKAHDLSDKAYRGLKQAGSDPIKALAKLDRVSPDELRALGAQRLKALLSA